MISPPVMVLRSLMVMPSLANASLEALVPPLADSICLLSMIRPRCPATASTPNRDHWPEKVEAASAEMFVSFVSALVAEPSLLYSRTPLAMTPLTLAKPMAAPALAFCMTPPQRLKAPLPAVASFFRDASCFSARWICFMSALP